LTFPPSKSNGAIELANAEKELSVGKGEKENRRYGSNGTCTGTNDEKQNKEKTVRWADRIEGNGDKRRVLANVMK